MKHEHDWQVSQWDCPCCGGLMKFCSGRINKNKLCNLYKCFSDVYCRDRENRIVYRYEKVGTSNEFERIKQPLVRI